MHLVGCVPPAAVAVCWGGGCLPQCMLGYPLGLGLGLDTPGVGLHPPTLDVGLDNPSGCGPGHPPDPPTSHLGLGLETSPHPWTEFLTYASGNITLAQLRCGR